MEMHSPDITLRYIDSGFWRLSKADALIVADGKLPKPGYEKLVYLWGDHWWLARTSVNRKPVWSMRKTPWRLVDGRAVLGEETLACTREVIKT